MYTCAVLESRTCSCAQSAPVVKFTTASGSHVHTSVRPGGGVGTCTAISQWVLLHNGQCVVYLTMVWRLLLNTRIDIEAGYSGLCWQ